MVHKLFGQEWSTDLYLAYNCKLDKKGRIIPEMVINFCEMHGKICRAEKDAYYQRKPIRTLNQPDSRHSILAWSLWEPEPALVKRVMRKFQTDGLKLNG